jgi:hypothetical protein
MPELQRKKALTCNLFYIVTGLIMDISDNDIF